MGEAKYVNGNLYNEVIVCDICNETGKNEFTKFIKHRKVCSKQTNKGLMQRVTSVFKPRVIDVDITLMVCQSCVSRAFRKYDKKI